MSNTFKIHYTLPDGTGDFFIATRQNGEPFEDFRKSVHAAVEARNGTNAWSEEVSPTDDARKALREI